MWIVAVAWVYVVGLMAVTEHSFVAGFMTFFGYCVLPLSILFYLTGGRARRARRDARNHSESGGSTSSLAVDTSTSDSSYTSHDSSHRGTHDSDCSSSDSSSSDSSCSDSGSSDSGSSSD